MSLRAYLALQDRDRIPYWHGLEASVDAVRTIVLEAGHADATALEVGLAYIAHGQEWGETVTVGEVAEAVIARRNDGTGRLFE